MKLRRRAFAFAFVVSAAWILAWFFPPHPRVGPLAVLDNPSTSLLIFAPHSDDETLVAGGLLQQAEEAGLEPHVVLVTAGDSFVMAARAQARRWRVGTTEMQAFGTLRLQESLQGLAVLGLPPDRLTFLGYPDARLDWLWTTCWRSEAPCVGPATGTQAVPYAAARTPGAPYSGESLYRELVEILEERRPTIVVYPHPNDAHRDHWALSAFVTAALEELRMRDPFWDPPAEWLYLVHRGDWPAPKGYRPHDALLPPQRLAEGSTTEWHQLDLTPAQVERKTEALAAYRSQVALMRRYLQSFVRRNELFGTMPRTVVAGGGTEPATWVPAPEGLNPLEEPPWSEFAWHLVIADPRADTVGREVRRGADVLRVWAANDGERLHLAVRTAEPRKRWTALHLLVRSLQWPGEWSELTRVVINPDGSHSVTSSPLPDAAVSGVASAVQGNWTRIDLPLTAPSVLVNFESYYDRSLVDRTAWQLLSLRDEADGS